MFELVTNADSKISQEKEHELIEWLYHVGDYDLTLLCDFGHGLFENGLMSVLDNVPGFKALNVQTNSSNFGFNLLTKHKKFDFLTVDTREARLAAHDRYSERDELFKKIRSIVPGSCNHLAMTLGPHGSCYAEHGVITMSPAFADKVIDATRAGDAFFAIASLFIKVGAPPEIIPFVGNVFAGLKLRLLGNEGIITKGEFVKAAKSILA